MSPHRTLFQVLRLDRPRRARRKGGHEASDVTRFRAVWLGAAAAAIGVAAGYAWSPPNAGSAAAGALALPHASRNVACESCHAEGVRAASSCVTCHGSHRLRPGHQRLAERGELGCIACHDVHGDDQGVRFEGGRAVRYGVGASQPLTLDLPPVADATVVLVPLARCRRCHGDEPADPLRRCGGDDPRAPSTCFDEHHDGSRARSAGAACSQNHLADRHVVWEAARAVALEAPEPPRVEASGHGHWLLGGALGGIGGTVVAGLVLSARRRRDGRLAPKQVAAVTSEKARLPIIDTSTCLGCYACVDACPYDVLSIERYVAVVDRPDACCGLTLCEQVCPNGSLRMAEIGAAPERILLDGHESQDAPGVYLAGDVTGVPLIKNAILQGTRAVEQLHGDLPRTHSHDLDLVIVGAGPAGIAAALRAKELGLRFEVVEQGSVAQSIRSFPRGKLVFDQPLELPVAGKLWLEESTKEELLAKWLRIVRGERLPIREQHRFVSAERSNGGFVVQVEGEEERTTLRAARLLLSIGMRGSPRKLPIALSEAMEAKVFYHLADARSFAGQRVLVVGLGDSAMETATALARQPDTEVTVSYRGEGFSRGKKRNVDELRRLIDAGRVRFVPRSRVRSIAAGAVALDCDQGVIQIGNDAVLVMIGSVAPARLLAGLGIHFHRPGDSATPSDRRRE